MRRLQRAAVIASRFTTPTTRLFVSSLATFNVDGKRPALVERPLQVGMRPGSDLFFVYSDGRDTSAELAVSSTARSR
jgi:hypothetical protein